jgi:predicted transcriptional regulator
MSELRDKLTPLYEFGENILSELNKKSDKDIKEFLSSVLINFLGETSGEIKKALEDSGEVTRKIVGEKCKEISTGHYDHIDITPFGISLKKEHGNSQTILSFYQHYSLNKFLETK